MAIKSIDEDVSETLDNIGSVRQPIRMNIFLSEPDINFAWARILNFLNVTNCKIYIVLKGLI